MSAAAYSLIQIGPKHVPSGTTVEYTTTFRLREFQMSNTTGSAITVSVYDGEGIYFIPSLSLAAGGIISGLFELGRPMTNGLTWTASGAGVDGYFVGT